MSDTATENTAGLLLCDDLMFGSKITGTAKALGLTMKTARTAAALQTLARAQPPRCVVIDLANPGLKIEALVQELREGRKDLPYLVAFGSHVDTSTLKTAREAGCNLVLPRSKFVEELPQKLGAWFGANCP